MTTSEANRVAHHEGELAYVDTFGPLLPCKVTGITTDMVTVRLTADRGAYRRGETLTERHGHVVPRASVHVRDGHYRIRDDYRWVPILDAWLAQSRWLGADAALAAVTWVEMSEGDAWSILADVDPEVMDRYPEPDLNGEWADSPTPDSVAIDVGLTRDELTICPDGADVVDAIATAWEEGRDLVWVDALQAVALRVVGHVDRALTVERENERRVTGLREVAGEVTETPTRRTPRPGTPVRVQVADLGLTPGDVCRLTIPELGGRDSQTVSAVYRGMTPGDVYALFDVIEDTGVSRRVAVPCERDDHRIVRPSPQKGSTDG